MGDVTLVRVGEEYHLFAELMELGLTDPTGRRPVGHAVSRDLLHWEELPPAIDCGPPGSFDGFTIYHMDVFVHAGRWHMFYTGLDQRGPGQQQAVGLATSDDGVRWTKHADNPVLRADPRWYEQAIPREAAYQEKDFGRLWFRDPCVIHDPVKNNFGMIVIARDTAQHPDVRGCLAWAESSDLVHWTPRPPIYSPGRFHTIETPSLFAHGGRHYIIFMSHPAWGPPPMLTDPYQDAGDFYAFSDTGPTGPYRAPPDEILVGSRGQVRFGAQRTIDTPDGSRMLYGWLNTRPDRNDDPSPLRQRKFLPVPKPVKFLPDGSMHAMYNPVIQKSAQPVPLGAPSPAQRWTDIDGGLAGKHYAGPSVQLLAPDVDDFIFSAGVELERGDRAGLVARADGEAHHGWYVVADHRFGRVEFGTLDNPVFLDARAWQPRRAVTLKIVACRMSVEVYADDRLLIHQARHREKRGRVGLIVERAAARFTDVRLLSL